MTKLLVIYDSIGRIYFQATGNDITPPIGELTVLETTIENDELPVSIDVDTGSLIYQSEV